MPEHIKKVLQDYWLKNKYNKYIHYLNQIQKINIHLYVLIQ